MTPTLIFFLQRLIELGLNRVEKFGGIQGLTPETANQLLDSIAKALPETLPSPEELEAGK